MCGCVCVLYGGVRDVAALVERADRFHAKRFLANAPNAPNAPNAWETMLPPSRALNHSDRFLWERERWKQ